jgi:hypothetical protein
LCKGYKGFELLDMLNDCKLVIKALERFYNQSLHNNNNNNNNNVETLRICCVFIFQNHNNVEYVHHNNYSTLQGCSWSVDGCSHIICTGPSVKICVIVGTYYFLLHVLARLNYHQMKPNTKGNTQETRICFVMFSLVFDSLTEARSVVGNKIICTLIYTVKIVCQFMSLDWYKYLCNGRKIESVKLLLV